MADEPVTLGEVGRRLDRLTESVDAVAVQVHELAGRDRADLVRMTQLDQRVSRLEAAGLAIIGIVGTAIVSAVLSLVL